LYRYAKEAWEIPCGATRRPPAKSHRWWAVSRRQLFLGRWLEASELDAQVADVAGAGAALAHDLGNNRDGDFLRSLRRDVHSQGRVALVDQVRGNPALSDPFGGRLAPPARPYHSDKRPVRVL